jgi:hypothetical protein
MNTYKPITFVFALFLIFFGGAALLLNTGFSFFGFHLAAWRLWPLFIMGLGLVFAIAPLLARNRPGLGGLFIPALPILTTGTLLAIGSLFQMWFVWTYLWPLEILSVALGFIFFAIYSRNIWLLIPALYIGANGAVLQFCALTGWWASWAVLWTVEPLCVGLMMLLIAFKSRSVVVMTVGLVISAFSLLAAASMSTLLVENNLWQFASSMGAVCFILAGSGLLLLGGKKSAGKMPSQPAQPTEIN